MLTMNNDKEKIQIKQFEDQEHKNQNQINLYFINENMRFCLYYHYNYFVASTIAVR